MKMFMLLVKDMHYKIIVQYLLQEIVLIIALIIIFILIYIEIAIIQMMKFIEH